MRQSETSSGADADAPGIYEKLGVKVIFATAQFLDRHTLRLPDKEGNVSKLTSKYFVIGAGSSPIIPSVDGIAGVDYHLAVEGVRG